MDAQAPLSQTMGMTGAVGSHGAIAARVIRIRGWDIDPARLASTVFDDGRLRARVVQFRRALTAQEKRLLERRFDLALERYLPGHAYLERLDAATVDAMRYELPYFQWSLPLLPTLKIDRTLGQRILLSASHRQARGLAVRVIAFPWADLDVLASAIGESGLEIIRRIFEPDHGIHRLLVRLAHRSDAEAIASFDDVDYVEEVGDLVLNNDRTSAVLQSGLVRPSKPLWNRGLYGNGQVIGFIDGAVDIDSCFFRDATETVPGPDHRKIVGMHVSDEWRGVDDIHGTGTAGSAAGEDIHQPADAESPNGNNGNAPRARISVRHRLDLEHGLGSVSLTEALTVAHSEQARVHVITWTDRSVDGKYTTLSAEIDRFAWQNETDLIIASADNLGLVEAVANSKNALIVNATRADYVTFRSGVRSFTFDGRQRPDLMAPGEAIITAYPTTESDRCRTGAGSGTSFAAPAVAGAAALARQYLSEGWYPSGTRRSEDALTGFSGALIKAILLNATVAVGDAQSRYPGAADSGSGWGRLRLNHALVFSDGQRRLKIWDIPHRDGFHENGSHSYTLPVVASGEPLRVTLVWTDPPADYDSPAPVINDLDLVITAPSGATYRGNQMDAAGESIPDASVADQLNVVEMIMLTHPAPGDYVIDVIGNSVNVSPQGYALVATGAIRL
jgi:hypothetical protein